MSPGSPSVTSNASGRAADAERSLMFTAAARKPSSGHEIQSSRKWMSSTRAAWVTTRGPAGRLVPRDPRAQEGAGLNERILGHAQPVGQLGGVVLGADDQAALLES